MLLFSVYLAHTIASRLYKREQQLRETLIELDKAEITKQKYIMSVVHEIKSPIAAVQSILDLMLNKFLGPLTDEVQTKLQRARTRTDDSLKLINNILRISNLKLLDVTADKEFGLKALFDKLITNLIETASSKNIKIYFEDQRVSNIKLHGDETLLELAFSNLLGNAIKYGHREGVVYVTLISTEPDKVIIEIIDDGIGIPADEITSVFDQFYRARNIEKTHEEGTGLGLSLVKEIIERHQGTIQVKSPSRIASSDRPGTEFIVTLPLKREKLSKIDLDRYSKINPK
jgi:signal transduction histidine kinase